MQSPSGLNIKRLKIPGSTAKVFCDVSTDSVRPYLTVPFRRPAFDALHGLAHPGVKATVKLVTGRYVWPAIRADCREWTKTCIPDSPKTILQPPYDGPYEVVNRDSKTFTLKIDNKPRVVSIDRVKPAYIMAEEVQTPPDRAQVIPVTTAGPTNTEATPRPARSPATPPQQSRLPIPTPSTAPGTTRSGRRVRFPDRYQAGFA
ncbi:hypothetical protein ANTQUA_LOCUS2995 [Anthophora quadrimaculata]